MKFWRLRDDKVGESRCHEVRPRPRSRLGVECLEGRTLLSVIKALPTTNSERNPKQPAAYKSPAQATEKFPPYDIKPMILSATDQGGANSVFEGTVEVGGTAFPYSVIWLAQGTRPGYFNNIAQADGAGHFAFFVPVGAGSTLLQLFSENSVDDYSNIDTLTVNRGNAIEAWDSIALHAIQVQGLSAPEAARDLAVLHSAQYDAVSSVIRPDAAYLVHGAAPPGASAEAAADAAAYNVLISLFPTQSPLFIAAEKSALTGLPNNSPTAEGLALGQQVANATLANRANDGSTLIGSAELSSQFANVTPFVISSGSAYRPASPPSVGSAAYDQALSQVASLGRVNSTTRAADQTAAAHFWDDGAGTVTDPGHWNAIADQLSLKRQDSLATDARLFARLDFALADTAIASSDSQATYREPRPITLVRRSDPTFQPLLATPPTSSYVSDNAAYGAAAAEVLTASFGPNLKFTDNSELAAGLTRNFASLNAAASEDANSRIWGGVNFALDAQAGVTLGGKVAQAVLSRFSPGK